MSQLELSIVVPVYNEEGNIGPLHTELSAVAAGLGKTYEIVFVNDGSTDGTLARLKSLAARDPHLRVVDLDGNFGEAAALSAGFRHARGQVVVTLDGDGQNDPADIPRLLAKLAEGYRAVSGRRLDRREKLLTRVLPSRVANWLIAALTGVPVRDCGCGLKAYRREVVEGAALPRGMNRFLPAILGLAPHEVAEVEVRDRPRGSGRSHYGLGRLPVVARDLLALPFLIRGAERARYRARLLGATAAALAAGALVVLAAARPRLVAPRTAGLLAALGLLGAAASAAIAYNLERFSLARERGVFRVRRVL